MLEESTWFVSASKTRNFLIGDCTLTYLPLPRTVEAEGREKQVKDPMGLAKTIRGLSYKCSTILIYNSTVVLTRNSQSS